MSRKYLVFPEIFPRFPDSRQNLQIPGINLFFSRNSPRQSCHPPQLETCETEKSTKILISWQELKNQFLNFLFIESFQVNKKPNGDCSHHKPFICQKNQKISFQCWSLQTALIFNLKFANINFPCICKRSHMVKFGHL